MKNESAGDLEPDVPQNLYNAQTYDELDRFVSYWNQKEAIVKLASRLESASILEIGKGNGFLSEYLKRHQFDIETFDSAPDLKPDYIGDIRSVSHIVKKKFDIVCAFEVLEHIPYTDVPHILTELAALTKNYLVISLPQSRLYLSFWLKLNVVRPLQVYLSLPFPTEHTFDGEHHWELGKWDYPISKFRILLEKHFIVQKEYTHPLNCYHRFFILAKGIGH
jgi:2-polyprenyl-3-methyl-5-hydroxy-6-metoxy-1,4-benzoquinol methylase